MLPLLDGNSEHVAHSLRKIGLFGKKIRFETALDLIKFLRQTILITKITEHLFLSISYISTMIQGIYINSCIQILTILVARSVFYSIKIFAFLYTRTTSIKKAFKHFGSNDMNKQ